MEITFKKVQEILNNKATRDRFIKIFKDTLIITPKERSVVVYRLGLDDGVLHTLEETGKMFGVTRERIRQIEAKTLEKLGSFWGVDNPIDKHLTGE